jgi:predicted membrane-bound mannosyltransferase
MRRPGCRYDKRREKERGTMRVAQKVSAGQAVKLLAVAAVVIAGVVYAAFNTPHPGPGAPTPTVTAVTESPAFATDFAKACQAIQAGATHEQVDYYMVVTLGDGSVGGAAADSAWADTVGCPR